MRIPKVAFRIYSILLVLIGISISVYALFLVKHSTIEIQWSTATEFDTAGFNLYRSDSPNGPFIKINSEIIQASDDPLRGGSYTYLDANVVPGTVYWYQLEDVELSGTTTKHEPIQVRAERRGLLEGIVGLFTVVFGIFGLYFENRSKSQAKAGEVTSSAE